MQADLILFWVFAPISVASAIAMLVMRNAVHSALFLIVNFFCLALFYLVLGATFLFAVQIIVYAGAIMVLVPVRDHAARRRRPRGPARAPADRAAADRDHARRRVRP